VPRAVAEPAPAQLDSAPHVALRTGPSTSRLVLTVSAVTLSTLAASVAAFFAGWIIPTACFEVLGKPDPLCSAAGFALGGGIQLALALLPVPEVFRLAHDADGRGDIGRARLDAWRYSRWAAIVAALFVITYGVGAIFEHNTYGAGQPLLIVGAVGLLFSTVAFDALAIIGGTRGELASWQPSGM
jgi:hypothetical protein